jgi:hypothetical protein
MREHGECLQQRSAAGKSMALRFRRGWTTVIHPR